MIKGISVAYIHTPNKKLADWYEKTLGLKKGYGDDSWQALDTAASQVLDTKQEPRGLS